MRASVILPVHNGSEYLASAIESVLAQTYDDWELVVVNDGSTDDTDEIARAFAARNPRIRIVHLPTNVGQIAAHNIGVASANSNVIKILHADDRLLPACLERFVGAFTAYPEVVMVSAVTWFIDQHGARTAPHQTVDRDVVLRGKDLFTASVMGLNVMWVPSAYAFRKDAFDKVGGFTDPGPAIRHKYWGFDWEIAWRLGTVGGGKIFSEPLAEYRRHPQQISIRAGVDPRETFMRYYWADRIVHFAGLAAHAARQIAAMHFSRGLLRIRQHLLATSASANEPLALHILDHLIRCDPFIRSYENGRVLADLATLRTLLLDGAPNLLESAVRKASSLLVPLTIVTGRACNAVAAELLLSGQDVLFLATQPVADTFLPRLNMRPAVVQEIVQTEESLIASLLVAAGKYRHVVVGSDNLARNAMLYDLRSEHLPVAVSLLI